MITNDQGATDCHAKDEDEDSSIGGIPVDVVVVIVTYNSAHDVLGLLHSLDDGLGEVTADVVVVDNGSTDGTVEALRECQGIHLVLGENVGYAAALNAGIRRAAPSEAILLLNPDTLLYPQAVARMMVALREPGVGIVAPLVRNPDGSLFRSLRREPTIRRAIGLNFTGIPVVSEYVARPEEYRTRRMVDWALGAVLLFSRRCYEAVGGWDESFFLYSEETDFCLRARDLGFGTLFEPGAEVMHVGGGSGRSTATHVMQTLNRVRLYGSRHSTLLGYGYWAVSVLSEASWLLRGKTESRGAVRALVQPSVRPSQLGISDRLLPR